VLAECVAEFSRSYLQQLLAQGAVTLNGRVLGKPSAKVAAGDRMVLEMRPTQQSMAFQPEDMALDVVHEDEHLLVVNKPAGLVVHPAPGNWTGTLLNGLLGRDPKARGTSRAGIVHRLDKDTTGAIAVAKTEQAFIHLQNQFKTKTARRTYLGMVYGAPKADSGTVDQPIGRHPRDRQKQAIVAVEQGGRSAITHWTVKERIGSFTLMQFELDTGRTHQIRVHAAHMGHPVVGDPLYSPGRKPPKVNLPGQALHAWRLRLIHPVTEDWIEAIAPVPETLTKLVDWVRRRAL
jgi:23S rRNA pseudouridine1911/1915/1917 synthase